MTFNNNRTMLTKLWQKEPGMFLYHRSIAELKYKINYACSLIEIMLDICGCITSERALL